VIDGRRLTVVAVVAAAVLLLAGTSYAMTLAVQPRQSTDLFAGPESALAASIQETMWESMAIGLGMPAQGLDAAVYSDSGLIDVMVERGFTLAEVAQAMLAAMETALELHVAQGTISPEQAEAMLDLARSQMMPGGIAAMGGTDGTLLGPWGGGIDMGSLRESAPWEWGRRGGPCHDDIDGAEYQPRTMGRVL
jgi:hypothetical protein